MTFDLSLADIFAVVIGTASGLLAAMIVSSRKPATGWFALFLGIFAYAFLSGVAGKLVPAGGDILSWLLPVNLAALPSLFIYSCFAVGKRLGHPWLHYLPVAVLLAVVPFAGMSSAFLYQLQVAQAFLYLTALIWLLRRYRRGLRDRFSALVGIDLKWLEAMCWGLGFLIIFDISVFPAARALGYAHIDGQATFNFVGTFFILWLARGSIQQYFVPAEMAQIAAYDKSGLDAESGESLATELGKVMDTEQLFLQSDLTLRDLASAAGLSPHITSEVLNTVVGQNFYDFVNRRRIEEAKRLLSGSDRAVLDIAFAAGFNNKVSFNQAFKKYEGTTPSAFRKANNKAA